MARKASLWQPDRLENGGHMGGPAAIRGYLVQTLVALLEALDDQDWVSVTLEPDHVSEKIDILWQYATRTKAVQVKSSIRKFNKANVQKWANDLEASKAAHEYELTLVGEAASAVRDLGHVGKVAVPPPESLDLDGAVERIAHRLDRFLESQRLPRGNADCREMVAGALAERLARLSAKQYPLTRDELIELLKQWVSSTSYGSPITVALPKDLLEYSCEEQSDLLQSFAKLLTVSGDVRIIANKRRRPSSGERGV